MKLSSIHLMMALALVLSPALAVAAPAAVEVRYFKGQPSYISTRANSVVEIVMPPPDKGRRVSIMVAAVNRSSKPQNLGYENVTIRTPAGAPVTLLTYEVLEHQAKVKAGWQRFAGALAAGASSYGASMSAYGTAQGTAYTSSSLGDSRTNYSASYYSPEAAKIAQARANAQNREMFRSIQDQMSSTLNQLDGTILRTTTINPGDTFGGDVVFDLPKGMKVSDLIVTINYAGETHEINLDGSSVLANPSDEELRAQIELFSKQPGHERFEELRPKMIVLLNGGQAETLEEAYTKALASEPSR